jgi:hypothetical protein
MKLVLAGLSALLVVAATTLVLALVDGCGSGLSPNDLDAVKQSATLNAMAYRYEDAATPSAALERAAYCADWGIANRNHLSLPDSGIQCVP